MPGPLLHIAEDVGEGPVVVLLHGIASSSVTFQNVLPLIRDTHRCIAIDLLGFGDSPAPQDNEYRVKDHVKAVRATLKSLKLQHPFTLVGHSMGALISARYTARYRSTVDKLVLVSPPIYLAPGQLARDLDRGVMDFYLRAYRYLRENKEFTIARAAMLQRLIPIPGAPTVNEDTWRAFAKSLENSIESQTTISDISRIDVPIEIVYGSMDEFHSEGAMRVASRMTGVTTHRVTGSAHLIGKRLARVVATAIG